MANRFWVGGGSSTNWDATSNTNWSATDGGANNASVPADGDDVFFKSAADCVLNVNTADIKSFDMTGYTGIFSGTGILFVELASGTSNVIFAGTINYSSQIHLMPAAGATINLDCSLCNAEVGIGDYGGTGIVNLIAAFSAATKNFSVNSTQVYTNGYSITCHSFQTTSGNKIVDITNSTITSNWNMTAQGTLTLTTTGSTINATDLFAGRDKIYNIVTLTGNNMIISGDNTITTLNINTAGLALGAQFTAGSTQTVTNFTTNGYVSNLAKIFSTSAGTHFHLAKAGGENVSVDYMSITDSYASPANTWYAGTNSTEGTGNDGWIFTDPPITDISKVAGIAYSSIKNVSGIAIASIKKLAGVTN